MAELTGEPEKCFSIYVSRKRNWLGDVYTLSATSGKKDICEFQKSEQKHMDSVNNSFGEIQYSYSCIDR